MKHWVKMLLGINGREGLATVLKKLAAVALGNAVLAFAVASFVVPHQLVMGGATGLGLLFHKMLGIDISLFVSGFNLLMLAIGFWALGRAFALSTLLSSLLYPGLLALFSRVPSLQSITGDLLLSTIWAGLLAGAGIGLVLRVGSSTGGTDIPPLILHRKLGLSLSMMIYLTDAVVLLPQILFSSGEEVLYGLLLTLLLSLVIDRVMLLGKGQTQVMIISEKTEEISQAIQNTINRGVTLLEAETGYLREKRRIVLSVVSPRELPRLNRLALDIDPTAFLIISQVNEVQGRGFTIKMPKGR